MNKKILIFIILSLTIVVFSSCTKRISDIVEPTKVIVQTTKEVETTVETKNETETQTTTVKETIETTTIVEEETEETIESLETETNEEVESKEFNDSDNKTSTPYNNKTDIKYLTTLAPLDGYGLIDLTNWEYGMTPCEWIKLEPNVQIICNNRPNTSENFSIKTKSSTGSKGCFLPVFIKTNSFGNDYDGRFYSFVDYNKKLPEEMLFSNSLEKLEYQGQKIIDILSKKYNIEKFENGIIKANGEYVNVVYIDELDNILNNN